MALELEFRIPTVDYGYIGVTFRAEDPYDLKRAARDADSELWTAVGDAYARAMGMATLGKDLGAQVVSEEYSPQDAWPTEPPASYGGYEAQQPPAPPAWAAQQAPQNPPGVQAPGCAHGPAKLVPAGVSKSTNKPYGAFWACQAPRGVAKCQMPKYQG